MCVQAITRALAGDLIERFREGQTRGWFWKEVLIAFAVAVLGEIWRYWPHFCYAVAGLALPVFLGSATEGVPRALFWWVLPWPWSQVIFELSRTVLLALAALPALAAGLIIKGEFRWASLFRAGAISMALIATGHYLIDIFLPWLSRPVPGDPYHRALIIPGLFQVLLFFSSFLIAAWIGCRSAQRVDEFEMPSR
jgi:hypothetical protein